MIYVHGAEPPVAADCHIDASRLMKKTSWGCRPAPAGLTSAAGEIHEGKKKTIGPLRRAISTRLVHLRFLHDGVGWIQLSIRRWMGASASLCKYTTEAAQNSTRTCCVSVEQIGSGCKAPWKTLNIQPSRTRLVLSDLSPIRVAIR